MTKDIKMRNKKNIYFLLPAVLLIWGLLGYRLFSAVQPNNTSTDLVTSDISFEPNKFKESEPFTIMTNYRDPFLGTITTANRKNKKSTNKRKSQPIEPFPQIVYKGLVSSQNNKQQIFIIGLDGKQHFFKKNQSINGVKLRKGNAKSISLKFQGQQQTFSIAN